MERWRDVEGAPTDAGTPERRCRAATRWSRSARRRKSPRSSRSGSPTTARPSCPKSRVRSTESNGRRRPNGWQCQCPGRCRYPASTRHAVIAERHDTPIIPIRKNGCPWKEDCPALRVRNETLRATRCYGRAFWKHWTGYHARSRIEARILPEILRRAHRCERRRPTDRKNPNPHRPHEPLQRPRHRQDHPRGMTSVGQGEVMPQACVLQQFRSDLNSLDQLVSQEPRWNSEGRLGECW